MCHTKSYTLYVTILHNFSNENFKKYQKRQVFDEFYFLDFRLFKNKSKKTNNNNRYRANQTGTKNRDFWRPLTTNFRKMTELLFNSEKTCMFLTHTSN